MFIDNWPKVVIIILNWNGWRDTIECLESLQRITYPEYEIVVLDNGSTDGSANELQKWLVNYMEQYEQVKFESAWAYIYKISSNKNLPIFSLLVSNVNLGYSGGCNLGIRFCLKFCNGFEFILVLNNDARVKEDTLAKLIEAAKESGAGIIAGTVIDPNTGIIDKVEEIPLPVPCLYLLSHLPGIYHLINKFWLWFEYKKHIPYRHFRKTGRVWGPMLLINRKVIEQMEATYGRIFNEELFMYGDETDLSYHVRKLGWLLVSTSDAVFYHPIGRKSHPRIYYYSTRNAFHLLRIMIPAPFRWFFYFMILIPFYGISALRHYIQGRTLFCQARLEGIYDGIMGKKGQWRKH
jgi:GT2 family glycosyltransferase